MKIGILTYHKAENYGAVLQAVALRQVLSTMGHDVCYLDYYPAYHRDIYRIFSLKQFFRKNRAGKKKYLKRVYHSYRPRKKRKQAFRSFGKTYIVPFCRPTQTYCDVVVYGSDQVWRKQPQLDAYNPIYFGVGNTRGGKHVSYAASMKEIPETEPDKKNFNALLCHLDAISVREELLNRYIQEAGYSSELVLDPTLLLNRQQWESVVDLSQVSVPQKPYLLYYNLHGKNNAFDRDAVRDFASRNNLTVVELLGSVSKPDTEFRFGGCGPEAMMALVKNASCVLSSSYHGMIFAILYHKPFAVAIPSSVERVQTVLSYFGAMDCLWDCKLQQLPSLPVVDFEKIDARLEQLRAKSIAYLTRAIEG